MSCETNLPRQTRFSKKCNKSCYSCCPWSRCWRRPSRPDLGWRRPSRLVATATEDRLSIRMCRLRQPAIAEQSRFMSTRPMRCSPTLARQPGGARSEQLIDRTFYRLADEPRETILVACSKCDWKAAYQRAELIRLTRGRHPPIFANANEKQLL